jgi:hypothetical protein
MHLYTTWLHEREKKERERERSFLIKIEIVRGII